MAVAALIAAFCAAGMFMVFLGLAQQSEAQAVMQERLRRATQANPTLNRPFFERMLHPLGNYLRGRTGQSRVRGLQNRILAAGRPYNLTVPRMLAIKALAGAVTTVLMAVLFVFLGIEVLLLPKVVSALVLAVVFGFLGYFIPDLVLGQVIRDRRAAIRRQLPDVCDLLSVFIDAGAPFDVALERLVASPWVAGPLVDELETAVRSYELGTGRAEALLAMAERLDVEEVTGFVYAITRSFRMGTRITDLMRVIARDVRRHFRERAEEQANQAGVKMLFPLVFLIFPCLFLVIITPALLSAFGAINGSH